MAITFHPARGTVLMCDYSGFKPPEMVKTRPVVVLSRKHPNLVTVVPLSSTEPYPLEKCHHEMHEASLPAPFQRRRMWAKCDLITTVAFRRLDRVRVGKHPTTGKRIYHGKPVRPEDLTAIQEAVIHVIHVLGLSGLTK